MPENHQPVAELSEDQHARLEESMEEEEGHLDRRRRREAVPA